MSARKTPAVQKEPTLPSERALTAITAQLAELEKLKGRRYDEADGDETKWKHQTRSIIEAAYGDPSSELSRFHMARAAGQYNIMGISPQQRQKNLESLVATLRLHLPEEEIKGVYKPGDEYSFYRDLSSIVQTATQEVFIVDGCLGEELFNLYVSKIPDGTPVRILSNNVRDNVETVARKYANGRRLELRSSGNIHDRAIFLDQRGWVIGQSIKDAGRTKPTYMIELNEPLLTAARDVYNRFSAAATVVI
jgi:hypothetical protein